MSSSSKRRSITSPKESHTANPKASSTRDVFVPKTSRSVPSQVENSNTGCSVFTDDILPLILDNVDILTSKDLLNFRLVNRCWRNAATSVLLKQNACDIALEIGEVGLDGDVNPKSSHELLSVDPKFDRNERRPPIFKFYSARPPHSLLPALTQLISTSPEFPSNSITFRPGCEKALRNLPLRLPNQNYLLEEDELTRLFALFGKTIKKLSLSRKISSNTVEKLLFLYLPNLHCLDLTKCSRFESIDQDQNRVFHLKMSQKRNSNLTLPKLQRIIAGSQSTYPWCKALFLREIVEISPNICAVEDVGIGALDVLIKMRRTELIKSLHYNPTSGNHFAILLERALRPGGFRSLKLSHLTIKLSQMSGKNSAYGNVSTILNIILQESKDTLKYLEVHVNPKDFLTNILIPLLGNLKCLKLVGEPSPFGNPLGREMKVACREQRTECGVAGQRENVQVDQWVYDMQVFKFGSKEISNNRIPPGYFPALSKVCLDVDSESMNIGNKLLAFLALEHTDGLSIVRGDILPTVTTLELTAFPDVDKKLGKLFPNLRNLRIKCDPLSELHNWVWRAFPKLERFYIYDYVPATDKAVTDNFFTGFSQKFCTKFSTGDIAAIPELSSPEDILILRTEPYIGECWDLRKLTIQFREKLSCMFVSKLTDVYAFQGIVHRTKIVFSFESVDLNEKEIKDIQKYLKPIAPYIEILV